MTKDRSIPPSFSIKLIADDKNPAGQQLTGALAKKIFLHLMKDVPHEEVHIIMLDPASCVIGTVKVSQGGKGMSSVVPADILRPAIAGTAHAVVVGHNHPQGVAEPSEDDLEFTSSMASVIQLAGVELVDHIIINEQGDTYSMQEQGDIEDD